MELIPSETLTQMFDDEDPYFPSLSEQRNMASELLELRATVIVAEQLHDRAVLRAMEAEAKLRKIHGMINEVGNG